MEQGVATTGYAVVIGSVGLQGSCRGLVTTAFPTAYKWSLGVGVHEVTIYISVHHTLWYLLLSRAGYLIRNRRNSGIFLSLIFRRQFGYKPSLIPALRVFGQLLIQKCGKLLDLLHGDTCALYHQDSFNRCTT